ncbi:MAG: type II secretion system minor pseudopilin GspK [Legionellaceae bacterium]|nr:type II secretion system minor pseudopilin GspK [Legionellaceae bacterium]
MHTQNKLVKVNGSALITALFIMTLIAITVTSMSSKLQLDIHNARIVINSDKLYLASQAVSYWAIDNLKDPNQKLKPTNSQGKILIYPEKFKNIYPGVKTTGEVYDLQAKFNLNNLVEASYQTTFLELIKIALPKTDNKTRKLIVDATTNWVKGIPSSSATHDEWLDRYLSQDRVYLPGYQLMQSVSEFRTVFGITPKIYNALIPYITAIPETTAININTASKAILKALGGDIKDKDIEKLIKLRKHKEIKNINEISKILITLNIPSNELTVNSDYFLIVARTTVDDLTFTNYTTVKRFTRNDKKLMVDVVKNSFNTI